MRIVFFGTPQLAATILQFLSTKSVEILAVVSRPDKPKGRSGAPQPTPVKEMALQLGCPLYQPKKASDPEFAAFLRSLNPDFFIVAAYAEILKENILTIPRFGALNVHGSLLPAYRGAAPIQRALMAGEKESGIAIMKMVLELDAGDVYAMEKIILPEDMTAGELFDEMAKRAGPLLWDVMKKIENGEADPIPQDHSKATFAKKVSSEEGEVDWKRTAVAIHNQIRGLTPNPGAWCYVEVRGEKKRLRLKKTRVEYGFSGEPGAIISYQSRFFVACREGALELLEVQLEGKKALSGEVFIRGLPINSLKF